MKNKGINNTKVGLFVLAAVFFLVFMLYMVGRNRNLFGATFILKAEVNNVNGLLPGNNVRFKGMDVGTVKSINLINDTLIYVIMVIDNKMKPYIKKNAIASIGTDGLMGNKLININSYGGNAKTVEEGDLIHAQKPVETDEMLRTLNTTNNTIAKISSNLYDVTSKLNSSKSLWTLLSDTLITYDLKTAVSKFSEVGSNAADLTQNGKKMMLKFSQGNGLASKLFTDTALSQKLKTSLLQIEQASQQASNIMNDLNSIITNMKQGEGTAGLLLADTALRKTLSESALNIKQGTDRFNQNMEALKTNFLFRGYFRRLEKKQSKQNFK